MRLTDSLLASPMCRGHSISLCCGLLLVLAVAASLTRRKPLGIVRIAMWLLLCTGGSRMIMRELHDVCAVCAQLALAGCARSFSLPVHFVELSFLLLLSFLFSFFGLPII